MTGRMLLLCLGLCEETLLESSRSLPVEGSDFPVQEKRIDKFSRGVFVSFIGLLFLSIFGVFTLLLFFFFFFLFYIQSLSVV